MNEQLKTLEMNQIIDIAYRQAFLDSEAAAKLAIEHGIKHAILKEREACATLVEADGRVHPKAPDAVWAKTVAKLIRARGNHE